ncbi:hypothetical protein SEA_BIGGITYBASS_28 [Gordonia phage BiggityBass]|nr:hypothetical protein SEA_BIGGITYBASS_28 [Gordonia phage BiggityBass]
MTEPQQYEIVTAADLEAFHAAPEGSALWFSFANPTPEGEGQVLITGDRNSPPDDSSMYLTGKPAPEWVYWSDYQAAADYLNALILGQ